MSDELQKKRMRKDLMEGMRRVLDLEKVSSISSARGSIPMDRLWKRSKRMCLRDSKIDMEEALLKQLLHWFKKEFFTWMDRPTCGTCHSKTEFMGCTTPTVEEMRLGASNTEAYVCIGCNDQVRFPRYVNAETLLKTRNGRCGEWSQAFCLCCRSVGYETRWIRDWSDHVWTECYLKSQKRWIHCDPCENAFDKPLMYERGWKKQVGYVIAFSKDGVQDVTRRYTREWDVVMGRRNLVSEAWLMEEIKRCNESLRVGLSEERKQCLMERDRKEMEELIAVPLHEDDAECEIGRTSGSLQWRTSRGEQGETKEYPAGDDFVEDLLPGRIRGGLVTCSGQNEPHETCDCLFDGDLHTKWLDFGAASKKGSWVKYRIPKGLVKVVEYRITSANDCPERDPKDWELKGSADGGKTWRELDSRTDMTFSQRYQQKSFKISEPFPCNAFCLKVSQVAQESKANCLQISCLDLIGEVEGIAMEALNAIRNAYNPKHADTLQIMRRILENLLQEPDNPKYKRIRASNPKIGAVLEYPGGQQVLNVAGFKNGQGEEEGFLIASQVDLGIITEILQGLDNLDANKPSKKEDQDDKGAKEQFEKMLSEEFERLMKVDPEGNPNVVAATALKNVARQLE